MIPDPPLEARTVPRAVVVLALAIVAFSLLNIVVLSLRGDPSTAKLVQRGVRFLLTCGLVYFLLRGASWARWAMIVLSILAAITSLIGFTVLPETVPLSFRGWILVIGGFYGTVAGLLLFHSSVVSHFSRRALTPPQAPTTDAPGNA